ncbi:MAG: ABC transporter permease [Solirubrobacterales bacterium]|nr:ABC transporter permease [Solirubrobacterales bacterium]
MRVLRLKLRRDMRRQRSQFLAIGVTIFLGVVLFGASYDAYRNLDASYQRAFTEYRFANLTITGGDTGTIAAKARVADGVEAVEARTQADLPFQTGDTKLLGRVVGLPVAGQPAVNRVDVEAGDYLSPGRPDGVLVEQHTAEHFDLSPGDSLTVLDQSGAPHRVTSVGTAASVEYFWPARSRQQVITSPDDFGVLFAPEETARELAGVGGPNQVVVYYDGGRENAALTERLTRDAGRAGAADVMTRARQPSNSALQEDVSGFEELAIMFPLLFLTAAALATAVLMRRLVDAQRPTIGMLRAAGFSRGQLLRHYLGFGLVAGGLGGLVGGVVGLLLAGQVTDVYTGELSIPVTVTELRPATLVTGIAFGIVTGLIAAGLPAWGASKVPPAEAMRSFGPASGGSISLFERILPPLKRLPARWRMTLRSFGRNRRRTFSTALGVVLALVLILVSWGMVDTVQTLVNQQFDEIERQDAELYYQAAIGPADLDAVRGTDGVARAEPALNAEVTLSAGGRRYQTSLVGLRRDTQMHEFLLAGGGTTTLPAQGLLTGEALDSELGVSVGDTVRVTAPGAGSGREETVRDFVSEPLGTLAYTALDNAAPFAPAAGAEGNANSALVRFEPGADRDEMRRRLSSLPGVAAYEDSQAIKTAVDQYLGLFYAFVGVMLVFGGAMAFALIFNSMSSSISERRVEMATLRASGAPAPMLARLVRAENLINVAIGIVPGLIVGYAAAAGFMASFGSDQFNFDLQMRGSTLVLSAVAIVIVALISQIPGLRALRRINVATIIRERSG